LDERLPGGFAAQAGVVLGRQVAPGLRLGGLFFGEGRHI
jgi:hypothetical protein